MLATDIQHSPGLYCSGSFSYIFVHAYARNVRVPLSHSHYIQNPIDLTYQVYTSTAVQYLKIEGDLFSEWK